MKSFWSICCLLILVGCATYEPQYRTEEGSIISEDGFDKFSKGKQLEKTFYLIGDAGISPMDGMSTGLILFREYLKDEDTKDDYAIFLGDNIYDNGMPPEGDPERPFSEHYMDAQFQSLENFDGTSYIIPGNHDWYWNGLEGLYREQQYIAKHLSEEGLQPQDGCPLVSYSVSPNVQLIIIDSQWYLEDWNLHPEINDGCEIKSRDKFFIELENEFEKNKNKTIVFAMHHPMFTNGSHGGYFSLEKHLYPTQSKFPLPILASLVAQIRAQGGVSVQDRYNELTNKLMNRLAPLAEKHGKVVIASGHEHTLQYHETDAGLIQIVSGSGAKDSFAALGQHGLFSYGGQGFAVLDLFDDGSSYVRFYGDDGQKKPKLLYEKPVFEKPEPFALEVDPDTFPVTEKAAVYRPDSLRQSLFFTTVWGRKYQSDYTTPVTAKVALLDTLYGGLEVVRKTGNEQYNVLLLKDSEGNQYRMRSLKKGVLDISQPKVFEEEGKEEETTSDDSNTIPKGSFDVDFYTATHPYAALALPTLAEAVDIFHNESELFYIPKQSRLGGYNENFGDELYMLSKAPSESGKDEPLFEYPDLIETTDDILTKLKKGREVLVDEQNYIRSRLFDMLVGDWDREKDHWRWAEYANSDETLYLVPIPLHRDDAFSSFEGSIFDVARSIFGRSYQRQVYSENFNNLRWFNEEGVVLDRALLEQSVRSDWKQGAEFIQMQLSDSIIEAAFTKVPTEVQSESLQNLISTLKQRRDKLVEAADSYYDFLSSLQIVMGTEKADFFVITRFSDGKTNVKNYTFPADDKGMLVSDRTFLSKDTKEIWVYGLDGEDIFEVTGDAGQPIFTRIIGGLGNDIYRLKNGDRVKVYDHESLPNTIEERDGGNLRLTDVYNLNTFDYRKQIERVHAYAGALGYNPDDGFRTGAQYIYQINSFQRNPFSQKHVLNAAYYWDTESFDVNYEGEIANIVNDKNLSYGVRFTSPNYTVNYFGYGNESPNLEDEGGMDANRVQVQTISAKGGLLKNSNFGSFYKLQGVFEAITLQSPMPASVNPKATVELDETDYFGTLEGIYNYRSFDDSRNPTIGMMFDLNLGATGNFDDLQRTFGYLKTRLGFYNSLTTNKKWILKTQIRGQFNFGNRFEFYQAVVLDANTGLRAFREERFSGKSMLVGSADVRYSFDDFNIGVKPIQIGLYAGTDLGRVWIPARNSDVWHSDVGGGLWIHGSGGFTTTASAFWSPEETRITVGVGFDF
ncbi:metallophosphoesterase [Luteirhabdus pelagi]|uniref:metallophosphoesterase n=1 Tax=Luteirhabdus pelagi TaxID=2792783 RepID=UPI00193A9379|nr:metallophosphoesterase [Luteirhabdus pelagi]